MTARDLSLDAFYKEIAEKFSKEARKDCTINMRISSTQLQLIKQAAAKAGYPHYQEWIRLLLAKGLLEVLPETFTGTGDDY